MSIAPVADGDFVDPDWGNDVADAINERLNLGRKGHATLTSPQTTIVTTTVNIVGLSVTFTAVAGRKYKVTAEGFMFSSVANDWGAMRITDGSNNQLTCDQKPLPSTTLAVKLHCETIISPPAGSYTVKVRADRNVGTGSATFDASATAPAFILVEDIGS